MITRRCTQRQFLLSADRHVVQTFEYILAEAAERFGVTLYAWVLMGNHIHILIRDNHGNYPKFIEHLHKLISMAINDYLERHENLWSCEQANVVWVVENDDKFGKLIYILANPVAAQLVERVGDWPSSSSLSLNVSGGEKVIKKPEGYFRKKGPMPDEVTLRVARLEGFEELSQKEWSAKVLAALDEAEVDARKKRMKTKGRVLGRKAVLAALPTDTPATVEERRRFKPTVACQNGESRAHALDILRSFRADYADALRMWLRGNRKAKFPDGTYRMRLLGAPCERPRVPKTPLAASRTSSRRGDVTAPATTVS
ncbi:hypothetical protein AKJ09_04772 [Labilithrix luteola]|uniref:Transposase IS200-like domain-containing protein n=2 Tax=Labilithrix luteola TaxID=1391654 RepID=A0A0K1PX56_9BACT|nr:transposase [Labilithrix luteola]AKU98108.1 hypothetical protein AKJ09_04772 [Labilithrix luteola]